MPILFEGSEVIPQYTTRLFEGSEVILLRVGIIQYIKILCEIFLLRIIYYTA